MKIWLLVCLIGAVHWSLHAQKANEVSNPQTYVETIQAEDLKEYLYTLAGDEMEGRETGTTGQHKAAQWIASKFESWGLPAVGDSGTYFQQIQFVNQRWEQMELSLDGQVYKHLRDFYAFPGMHPKGRQSFGLEEVVFLGYGIDSETYSDYGKDDVGGKAVLVYDGEPFDKDSLSYVSGGKKPSAWGSNIALKYHRAKDAGAAALLVIDPKFKSNLSMARRAILNRRLKVAAPDASPGTLPTYFISPEMARNMIGRKLRRVIRSRKRIQRKGKSRAVTIQTDMIVDQEMQERSLLGQNVLGFIEGTDSVLKNEIVVVSAHFDHLGKRGEAIFNGADDNASGSSTVLELAQAFVEAKASGAGPRRSVLVLLVSGEEKGLLGSRYYTEYPVFPLEQTVVNINVDMVGRVDEKHKEKPAYIYVIGSDRLSTELHEINERMNTRYTRLELDYTYNERDDPNRFYYRSDHYNFAKNGIPAIFYFNGTHEDYHRPTDTAEKINYSKMEKVAKLIFYTAWEIANRDDRLVVDVEEE